MTYDPTWTNGTDGRVIAGEDWIMPSDFDEIASAVNRRRKLVYLTTQDFSSAFGAGQNINRSPMAEAISPPFDSFRRSLIIKILNPQTGGMMGNPSSPSAMYWLWPLTGSDENKIIVAASPGSGQISLFDELNGGTDWTDPTLIAGVSSIRAVHHNEFRQALEWMTRGRWEIPIYFCSGIYSELPDASWPTSQIYHSDAEEFRNVGFAVLAGQKESQAVGLANVTVRSSSSVSITVDTDCTVQLYHCLRTIDFINDPPSWNQYAPVGNHSWASPGGTGNGDVTSIGSVSLTANTPGTISGSNLTAALQAMVDGSEQNFLLRRSDTGDETITITAASLTVEFDLESPPN